MNRRFPGLRHSRGRTSGGSGEAGPVLNTPTLELRLVGVATNVANEGDDLTANATVNDGDGFVTTDVELYQSGVLVGSMVNGGGGAWSLAVNDVVPGSHSYQARRVTASGSVYSAAWAVVVAAQVPTLSAPADEASFAVGSSVTFTADGSAAGWDTNTTKVEFYLNAVLVATANSPTAGAWTVNWDSTGATPANNLSVVAKRYWTGVGTGTVDSTVATDIDLTPASSVPVRLSIATNTAGNKIIITYDQTLDGGSVPALVDYTLAGPLLSALTGTPAIVGATVELNVTSFISSDETGITLSYTAGGSPVQNPSGDDAPNFTTQAVTNSSTHDFVPSDVPEVVGWWSVFDSADFTESAGTMLTLKEKISNTSISTGTLPAYNATGLNSLPTMDANGTSMWIGGTTAAVANTFVDSGALTVFLVCAPDLADRAETLFGAAAAATQTNRSKFLGKSSVGSGAYVIQSTNNAGTTIQLLSTMTPTTTAQVLEWYASSTTTSLQRNGAAADPSGGAFAPGTLTCDRYGFFTRVDLTPDNFSASIISEGVVANVELSSAVRSRIRVYLGAKWSVTVTP